MNSNVKDKLASAASSVGSAIVSGARTAARASGFTGALDKGYNGRVITRYGRVLMASKTLPPLTADDLTNAVQSGDILPNMASDFENIKKEFPRTKLQTSYMNTAKMMLELQKYVHLDNKIDTNRIKDFIANNNSAKPDEAKVGNDGVENENVVDKNVVDKNVVDKNVVDKNKNVVDKNVINDVNVNNDDVNVNVVDENAVVVDGETPSYGGKSRKSRRNRGGSRKMGAKRYRNRSRYQRFRSRSK